MKCIIFITFALVLSTVGEEIDCDKAENVNEEHIHYCCKHPEDQNEVLEDCAKQTGFKLPNSKERNVLDITADRAMAAYCFSDCILNKMKFLKDHELDMSAVKKHFETKYINDSEYGREMINAFDQCHGKGQANAATFLVKHMEHKCNPKSSVILGCVVKLFFHNCPANRWSQTQECSEALKFSKNCPNAFATL